MALVDAGITEGRRSEPLGALLRALRCYQLAIAQGTGSELRAEPPADLGPWRAVFMALSVDGQAQVLGALSKFAIATANQGWRQPCHLALVLPMMERQGTNSNVVALLRQQPLQDKALSQAADFWLTHLGAGLAHLPQRPRQARDALCLARHRLALRRPARRAAAAQMSRLAKAPQGLAGPDAAQPLPPALARHLAQQQGWPVTLDSLAHWLLALAAQHCAHLLPNPPPGTTPFDLDVAALARAQGWNRQGSPDGTLRRTSGCSGGNGCRLGLTAATPVRLRRP